MAYLDQNELTQIVQIYESQGLSSKQAGLIAYTLQRWEKHYGIEWVVGRLKLMRSALLTSNNDGIKSHADGTFHGPFRPISKMAKTSRRGAVRAHRLLSIYGRWEAGAPTEEDYQKFSKSVEFSQYKGSDLRLKPTSKEKRLALQCQRASTFNTYLPTSNKRVPFIGKPERVTLPDEHMFVLLEECPNLVYKYKGFIQENLFDLNEFSDYSYPQLSLEDPGHVHPMGYDVVGKVVCLTSDRGLKKRFIANPHRFLQMLTSRLQDALARYLRKLPESLVFNQDEAVVWVQNQLRAGKTMNSLDLSSATDHFPFDLQEDLIRQLFPGLQDDIDLWSDICSCLWESPSGETDIRYGKGQPMGTRPSFAAFTVSHIHLVRSLGGDSSNFRVIGDDIVISDPELALRYRSAMEDLGVSVNLKKSILNDSKAEFAGRIIDEHGLWPAFKGSPLDITRDPTGYVRQYGLSALSLLPHGIQKDVEAFVKLPGLGPDHLTDLSVIDGLTSDQLEEIYQENPDLYSYDENIVEHLGFFRPQTVFEEAHGEDLGFRGLVGVGNPRLLVDHVNASIQDKYSSALVRSLENTLCGGPPLSPFKDDVKYPISHVKSVGRLVHGSKSNNPEG